MANKFEDASSEIRTHYRNLAICLLYPDLRPSYEQHKIIVETLAKSLYERGM